jgi:Cu(I)/Ag(I) efflux system membrane fusion protein
MKKSARDDAAGDASFDTHGDPPMAGANATPAVRSRGRALVAASLGGALVGAAVVYLTLHAPPAVAPAGAPVVAGVSAPTVAPALVRVSRAAVYRCPMHPAITSDHPGACPICGMTLVRDADPVTDGADASERGVAGAAPGGAPAARIDGLTRVAIDPGRQQMIGLRTAPAARAKVSATWHSVGRVEVDPTRVRRINVKVEGYVERVFVDFVGKPVRKGQPLLSIYSPSLLAAQEEYLLAIKTRAQLGAAGMLGESGNELVAASRRKLELWDVPAGTIERLASTGKASKALILESPIAGVVTAKNVVEGAALRPGDTPYEITDLRMVWVMADAYESDLGRVRIGMPATLTLPAYPSKVFEGRVEFIDPVVDAGSRTAKVHLHFANPSGALKPEMFGEVVFHSAPRVALRIPADAIIRTGAKDVVFVALGGGRFEPREVRLGASDGDFIEILRGLDEGQQVVTRANFLVDSESRLRASLAALTGK